MCLTRSFATTIWVFGSLYSSEAMHFLGNSRVAMDVVQVTVAWRAHCCRSPDVLGLDTSRIMQDGFTDSQIMIVFLLALMGWSVSCQLCSACLAA
jgi:hypothetical protein